MSQGLRLVGGDHHQSISYALAKGEMLLGSDSGCDLVVRHPSVSRRHARLVMRAGVIELTDLESRHGTFVSGLRVEHERIERGARVRFGQVEFRLEAVRVDVVPLLPEPLALPVEKERNGVPAVALSADAFVRDGLPKLHELLSQGASRLELALSAGPLLARALSLLALEIVELGLNQESLLFSLESEAKAQPTTHSVRRGELEVRARVLPGIPAQSCEPLLSVVASLVHLARCDAPALPSAIGSAPMPAPSSLVPAMLALYRDANRIAAGDISVLILGESGTGKELLAKHVHEASTRNKGPFVAINCAALSRDLLEAQLFGIERGVATGVEARAGIFEAADEGTLFLDEIGDMALETQARILRVLEARQVSRLGSTMLRPARFRIISATHHDLAAAVTKGHFRLDLYYRLAGWQAELPPLRARRADIPLLALHFLADAQRQRGLAARGLSRAAMELLVGHSWPGNVRQLKAEMGRAALFILPDQLVDTSCLSPLIRAPASASSSLKERLDAFERAEIASTLEAHGGDVDRSAQHLSVSRATLYRRLKELRVSGLPRASQSRDGPHRPGNGAAAPSRNLKSPSQDCDR